MPKFCMPTFGNGRNNTKTACICLYRVGSFPTWIGKPGTIFSALVNMRQTSRAGIPPDGVRLAEKLALVAFRLFPRPLWYHATEWCGAVGREPACVASKVCQLGDCEDRLSACTACYFSSQEYSCCYYRVCYRCLAVKSIWDWMKPCLVVKISSDKWPNIAVKYAFCLWCFAALSLCADMVSDCAISRKRLGVPTWT